MGKSSSAKAEVVEYRMSLHVALGHEVDEVREIRVDERVAWSGRISTNTTLNIHQPNLFGGQTKEGGLSGFIQVLMGRPDQVLPRTAASRYRRLPEDCPAFRGLTTLMFHGSGMVSTGRPGEWDGSLIGVAIDNSSYDNSGFLWKMNSTFIAQKIEVTATRAPKGIDNQTPGLNPAYALIGNDANPAHIIYEALVNRSWGMSGAPELIDKEVFEAEALRLFNEGFGLSFWWMRQQTIEDLITEILDHIQATIFVNPNNGLLSIRLLRDDYDIATLRHITPDNATLSNFKRRSSGEIVNEITVNFTNPLNEESESVTGQDIASIESQGGEKVAASRDYYMVRSRELATKILDRDLRASTAPLVSAEAKLDRSAWNILPGEVVLLSWPRRSMNAVVARVGKVSYGKPRDTAIRASLMQDVFSLTKPPVRVLPPTDWEDPTRDPQPLDMQLFTVPNYFVRNVELQDVPVELGAGEALVGSLADSETYDSFDYELVSESVTASGAAVITSKGAKSMTPKGVLATTLPAAANSTLPFALFPVAEETPVKGGFVFIGYGDDNQEITLVTGQSPAGWTIARGCLDTVPRSWAAGTPVWVVSPGASIVDTQTIHAEGSTARYRGLDRTARGLLGYDQAPSESVVVTARPHLPLRPANVSVNNVAFGSLAIGSASTVVVRWATRNRLTEDSQVLLWGDGSVQPEYRQETVIRVYDAMTNALLKTYGGLWTETSASFNRADLERYQALRFEVLSRRNGEWSLAGHSVTVTGLAGNPSAPGLPDTIVEAGPPPSFYPAPGVGAFAAQAVALAGAGGSENPAIEISGTPDNLDMRGLATRYRRLPAPDPLTGVVPNIVFPWAFGPTAVLNGDEVRFLITGVAGETEYEVQVAYVVDDLPGSWRNLGTVLTTRSIAGDTTHLSGEPTQDILDRLTDTATLADQNRQAVENLEEVYGDTASAAVSAAAAAASEAAAVQAKADAIIAKGEAQDARDEAAQKALDAAGSAAASAGSATAADDARAAAVIAKGEAQTARDTAATKATEAAGSASAALTSKNDAAASATTATQKATDAAGSAATATQQAGLAAGSATAAGGSATAAAGSASTAATKANEAGNSATAANASKVAAESARDTADQKATAAASSAASAATSSTQAGQSASAAQTAKTDAETARAQAQTSASNASDAATNAAGSAATASSAAGQSVTARDQSQGFANAANTSAQNAAGSATAAGNSASAANTSKTAAEAAYGGALAAAIAGFPDVLASDLLTAQANGSPTTVPSLNAAWFSASGITAPVNTAGSAFYKQTVPWKSGEVYEFDYEVEGLTGASFAAVFGQYLDASFAATASARLPYVATPNGVKTRIVQRIALDRTVVGATTWALSGTGTDRLRFGVIFNRTNTGAAATGQARLTRMTVRNVTGLVDTQSVYDKTVILGGNQGFEDGLTGWSQSALGSSSPANASWVASYQGRSGVAVNNKAGRSQFFTQKLFPIDTTRKYRIRGSHYVGAGTGGARVYMGYRSVGADGALNGTNNNYCVPAGGVVPANTGWIDAVSGVMTGEASGNGTVTAFPIGTKAISLMAYINYDLNTDIDTALDGIWLEDVTESENAKAQATASATSAASAAASATLAGEKATAAQTSATAADTSRGQAQTAASQASQSETNAAGSAASASSAATNAATSRDQASGFATAASGSASTASTKATEAGNSATAANAAKVAAESARDTADQKATAAAQSASSAATSSTQAGQSASAAQTAKTDAETARAQAQTFRNEAADSATNAAGSATTASSAAGQSVTAKDQAQGFATAANTSAQNAAGSATAAGNSASAANTSKTAAEAAYGASLAAAMTGYPDRVAPDLFSASSNAVAPISRPTLNASKVVDGWYVSSVSETGGIYYRSYIPWKQGEIYELTAEVEGLADTGTPPHVRLYGWRLNAAYGGPIYFDASATVPTPVDQKTVVSRRIGLGVTPPGGVQLNQGADGAWLNFGAIFNRVLGGNSGQVGAQSRIRLSLRNVTAQVAAETSATASATSAANAAASATLAGEKAIAAQTSATAADTSRGQAQTAASQASQSETNAAGSAASASSAAQNAASSRDQASGFATAASGSASTASTKATEAGNSAAAAAASQVSASAAKDAAVSAAIAGFPDVLASDLLTNVFSGAPATRPNLPANAVVNGAYTPAFSSAYAIFKQDVRWKDGAVYELTAGVEGLTNGTQAPHFRLLAASLREDYTDRSVYGISPVTQSPVGSTTRLVWRVSLGVTVPGATRLNRATEVERLRFGAHFNTTSTNADNVGSRSTLKLLTIRDITAQVASESSATAAATSASNAAASATTAGEKATAASGSATTAATKAGEASTFANQAASSAADAAGSAVTASTASGTSVSARDAAISARNDAQAAAATAVSQSSSASASAASAQISADLAVTAANSRPNLLPNSTGLLGMQKWTPYHTSQVIAEAATDGSRFIWFVPSAGALDGGSQSDWMDYPAGVATSISAEVFTGGMNSGGIRAYVVFADSSGNTIGYQVAEHWGETNQWVPIKAEGVNSPAGTRYAKVVIDTQAANWKPAGAVAAWRKIKFENWPTATPWNDYSNDRVVSAQLSVTAAVAADAQTRLSTVRFDVTGGAGGDPFQIWARADASGSSAGLVASELSFASVVGGTVVKAMKIIGGEVFFMRPIYIDVGSRRLIVGPGGTWVLWFGPNTIAAAAATRTNGYFALGSDGKVYYGNAELGGGGKTAGVRTFSSGPGGSAVQTVINGVLAGSQIGVAINLTGGTLTTNNNLNGSIQLFEVQGGNTRLLFSQAVTATSSGLQEPDGSWGVGQEPSAIGNAIGQYGGDVTYRAEFVRTGGSNYAQGAVINATVTITPPI